MQYRERFFKGSNFDLWRSCDWLGRWCLNVAGLRVHGTTRRQPLQVFQRQALVPWDGEPYPNWRTAKVHPDHHVACQYAIYSVPSALCPPGQQVEIGWAANWCASITGDAWSNPPTPGGGRSTDAADYPAELTAYTLRAPEGIKHSAAEQGPAVAEFADRLLGGPLPWSKIRQGHKLLRLGQRYTPERLDAACRRALDVDDRVRRVERTWYRPWSKARCGASPAGRDASGPAPSLSILKEVSHDSLRLKRLLGGRCPSAPGQGNNWTMHLSWKSSSQTRSIAAPTAAWNCGFKAPASRKPAAWRTSTGPPPSPWPPVAGPVFSMEFLTKHEAAGGAGGKSFLAQARASAVRSGYTDPSFFRAMAQARADNYAPSDPGRTPAPAGRRHELILNRHRGSAS